MLIERIVTPGLAQVAFLVGDEHSRELAVIDPRRDVAAYLDWALEHGYQVTAILETHVHADFISGAVELSAATGAPIYASRLGDQEFVHEPIDDGDEIVVGSLILRAIWTPGHTPEHMGFLLFEPEEAERPVALFSGDALFVGEVGRPDLLGEEQTRHLAEQLFGTVTERLSALDDGVVVYPGHTAGSACGKSIAEAPSTTIGDEKRYNYAFKPNTTDGFVDLVLKDMPRPPTYYPVLKGINKTGPPFLRDLDPGAVLAPGKVVELEAEGALIIDARSAQAFDEAHIPGAVFAGLGDSFSAWMGWLAPYGRDLVLVLEHDDQFDDARTELRRIGLDRIAGYLAGGMAAWVADGRSTRSLAEITVGALSVRLRDPDSAPTVLDVRRNDEWNQGHIPGAIHQEAGAISQGANPPIAADQEIAVICGSGYRSTLVASLLAARGYENLLNVRGGMDGWSEAEYELD